MKITESKIKQIIKEEVAKTLNPTWWWDEKSKKWHKEPERSSARDQKIATEAGNAIWARNANRAMIHLNKIDARRAPALRLAWDDVKKAYTKACKRGGGQKYVDAPPWNPKCDPEPLKKADANGASDDLAAQRWIQFALQHDRKKIDDKKSNWYYMKVEALAKRLWDLYKSGKTQ